jgi:hypothetical protein
MNRTEPTPPPKPNCYTCAHRRDVPGSAHSRCIHPSLPGTGPLGEALAILAGRTVSREIGLKIEALDVGSMIRVRGNPHGVRMGWFVFPWNFDPAWLEACDGFTPKPEDTTARRRVSEYRSSTEKRDTRDAAPSPGLDLSKCICRDPLTGGNEKCPVCHPPF